MRFASALLAGVLLLAGCGGDAAPPDPQPSVPPLPQSIIDVSIPPPSDPARPSQTLQAPVDAYTAAWLKVMGTEPKFDARVGVAGLAEGDSAGSFCSDKAMRFAVSAKVVTYCRAAHEGPDPAPYAAFILVPYDPFMGALGTLDAMQRIRSTGMVLARAYARHVAAELEINRIVEPAMAKRIRQRIDCIAGMTLRSFVLPMSDEQWRAAVDFATSFEVAGLQAPNEPDLAVGFGSGKLNTCLA